MCVSFSLLSMFRFRVPTEEQCVLTGGAGTKGGAGAERLEPSSAKYTSNPTYFTDHHSSIAPRSLSTWTQNNAPLPSIYIFLKLRFIWKLKITGHTVKNSSGAPPPRPPAGRSCPASPAPRRPHSSSLRSRAAASPDPRARPRGRDAGPAAPIPAPELPQRVPQRPGGCGQGARSERGPGTWTGEQRPRGGSPGRRDAEQARGPDPAGAGAGEARGTRAGA